MKKYNPIALIFFVPLALVAQSESLASQVKAADSSTQSSGIKDINPDSSFADYAAEAPIASDVPTDAEASDTSIPEIPNVSEQILAGEAEVVLDLPGQGDDSGVASIASKETISVDFPDEDVRTVLRSVADLFDLNLVIPDSLQGRTSIKLRNITWHQVFEVVLDPLGYTFVEDRNIVRIKSIQELTSEPVDTRIFIVSYARAEELKESISPLVDSAAGGNIQVDVRSNALVVKERPSRMSKIQEIIESLDQPTKQVVIESKFVEVSNTDAQDIGINWTSLSDFSVAVGSGAIGEAADTALNGFRVDYDRNDATGQTMSEAGVLSADQFEAVISALDSNSDVEMISNPTVVALNNTSAKIAIGERYPLPEYAFNAQTGERQLTGFEYIDIGVNLDVTPSVNDAGFINLAVIPEVSSIGNPVLIEGTQIPIINSRRTEAEITIKDGYTLAIGGLVEEELRTTISKVPLLGDLPGVGRLFRSNADSKETTNLIIFITAKTLDPDGSDYRDVVDPRVLNEMQILPSEIPGYKLSSEESEAIERLEYFRNKSTSEEEFESIQNEIDLFEKTEFKEKRKEEKKSKNR